MNKQKNSNKKQSMIAGALISSAGIFVAKFIGLFYAVPFNTLLGNEANVAMYGVAYNIYSFSSSNDFVVTQIFYSIS